VAISAYLAALRSKVGHDLLVLPSVTAAVFDASRRLLLVRPPEIDLWITPGGAVDPDESPADALVREVWEETALDVEPLRVTGVYGGPDFVVRYPNRDLATYVMTVFECGVRAGTPRPDGDETAEVDWFTEDQALRLPLPAWARIVLPDAFRPRSAAAAFRPPAWRPPPR
jgi:8-oxo-dGTP pyrophosphatase MutT (NUDIX family)